MSTESITPQSTETEHAAERIRRGEVAVETVDGQGEYAYADAFFYIFSTFAQAHGVTLSAQTIADFQVLLPAMEFTEKTLGNIEGEDARATFWKKVVDYLRHDGPGFEVDVGDAESIMDGLREAVKRRDMVDEYCRMLEEIFVARQTMMTTLDVDAFIAARKVDAILAAEFALVFVDEQPGKAKFVTFQTLVSVLFNFVDTTLDARRDFRDGQMQIRPGPKFYGRIVPLTLKLFARFFWTMPSAWAVAKVWWYATSKEMRLAVKKRQGTKMLKGG